jgi:GT2 family glycosyltransferase
MLNPSVFAHIVTFNNARTIGRCVAALSQQSGFIPGRELSIRITDNASHDGSREFTESTFSEVIWVQLPHNQGFRGVQRWDDTRTRGIHLPAEQ